MFDINHLEKRLEGLRKGRAKLDADLRAAEDRVDELTRAVNMQDGAIASLEALYAEALQMGLDQLEKATPPPNAAGAVVGDVASNGELVPKGLDAFPHKPVQEETTSAEDATRQGKGPSTGFAPETRRPK